MANEEKKNPENTPAENNAAQPQETPEVENRFSLYREIDIGVKPGYVLRKVGQAYMVMPTGPRMKDYEGMITLNETGAFLYKESEKPEATRDKLVEASMKEYNVDEEEAGKAVDSFITQCAGCGLFEYREVIYDNIDDKLVTKDEFNQYYEEKYGNAKPE